MSAREAPASPAQASATRSPSPLTAVVAGGGLAGVAAAAVLAERGVSVVLAEREPFLGGRAGAWTDRLASGSPSRWSADSTPSSASTTTSGPCSAASIPSCRFLEPLEDYPILGPGGQVESFSGLPDDAALEHRRPHPAHPDPGPARPVAGERSRRPRDAPLRSATGPTAATTRQTAGGLPRLAAFSRRRAPHALRRLRPLLLQPRGGDVGGRAADDVPLLLHREPRGPRLRRVEAAVLEVPLGARSATTWPGWAWTSAPAARVSRVARRARTTAGGSTLDGDGHARLTSSSRPSTVPGLQARRGALARSRRPRLPPLRGGPRPHPPVRRVAAVAGPADATRTATRSSAPPGWACSTTSPSTTSSRTRAGAGRSAPAASVVELHAYAVDPATVGGGGARRPPPGPPRLLPRDSRRHRSSRSASCCAATARPSRRGPTPIDPACRRPTRASPWPATSSACRSPARSWSARWRRASWPPTSCSRHTGVRPEPAAHDPPRGLLGRRPDGDRRERMR